MRRFLNLCATEPLFQLKFSRHRNSATAPHFGEKNFRHQKFASLCSVSQNILAHHYFSKGTCLLSHVSCLLSVSVVSCLSSRVSYLLALAFGLLSPVSGFLFPSTTIGKKRIWAKSENIPIHPAKNETKLQCHRNVRHFFSSRQWRGGAKRGASALHCWYLTKLCQIIDRWSQSRSCKAVTAKKLVSSGSATLKRRFFVYLL